MEAKIKETLGETLHQACENNDLNEIKTYIAHQQATNPSYKPPLPEIMYTATGKDNVSIIQYCIENGTTVTDNVLKKILICRAKKTYIYLLDAKAVNVNHYIPWFGDILTNVATADDMEWAKLCLEHGADPNRHLYEEHKSMLAAVAELASVEMAKLLIEHGARVKGSGAIVMAAEEGKLDMVELLLENGADVDEVGIEHPTDERYREDMGSALHRAVFAGRRDVVRVLIGRGADVGLKDPMGRTAGDLAGERGDEEILGMLRDAEGVGK